MNAIKFAGLGLALNLAACSGTGNSSPLAPVSATAVPAPTQSAGPSPSASPPATAAPTAKPTATPSASPGIAGSITQTVRLGLVQTVVFPQIASGVSGSVTFPATLSGAGTAAVTLGSALPEGVPVPQAVRRSASSASPGRDSIGAAVTPLAYVTVNPGVAVSFAATPVMTFTVAHATAGYAYLAVFNLGNPKLGWTTVAGPSPINATSLTIPAQSYPGLQYTIDANDTTIFAIVRDAGVIATPSPGPYSITEYPVLGTASQLGAITGSNGKVWFYQGDAQHYGNGYAPSSEGIDSITSTGVVARHSYPSPPFRVAAGVAAGPNNEVWFTESANNAIGEVSATGSLIADHPLSISGSLPYGIAYGADGNFWFCEPDAGFSNGEYGAIGKMTPKGIVTNYPLPVPSGTPANQYDAIPLYIAAGPGGNLWFTLYGSNQIGKITTSGVVTYYPLPPNTLPLEIVAGPGGNMWFVQQPAVANIPSYVSSITPAGVVTQYPVPQAYTLGSIAYGSDGNIWAGDLAGGQIFRVSPTGVATVYETPTLDAAITYMTSGPDGNIWFVEPGVSQIGKLLLP